MISNLQADAFRLNGIMGWRCVLIALIARRTFRPIVSARLLQWAMQKKWRKPAVLVLLPVHAFFRWLAAMDFPHQAEFGAGLRIDHGWGLVVNAKAKIGSNVTLFHGVTLGQLDRVNQAGDRTTTYPVVEDEVWIGPHATVVGATVGRGSRIAAGAFVNFDVPAYSLVVGNPGQVVRSGVLPDVAHPVASGVCP